jgi:major vault protein
MAGEKRDLIVSPGEYAYLRDGTKGTIKVFTGPTVATPSAQDEGIVYDAKTGAFVPCADIAQAKQKVLVAPEGFYLVMLNPAKNGKQPEEGQQSSGTELDVGRKVNIPGPFMKALWPGQSADVIRGHQLRSNQYLIARVYNEDEARKNWNKAIMKPVTQIDPPADGASAEEKANYAAAVEAAKLATKAATAPPPKDLAVGTLLIIKGTEVSFYIPPTGISVAAEAHDDGSVQYVREALTLERLEYAILLGENGNKKYVPGPTVVFPSPTERFMEGKTDEGQASRKFRAIELNELQGLHLKVIADFKDEKGIERKAGEELFMTGKDTAIYYPREEVSAVKYDGKTKHFASAVPVGEGRYVLNRMTGEITTRKGPDMLLPDPRTEVIVRRVLADRECQDWYPGNTEALGYNQNLREILKQVPTTRGAPSEGDIERNYKSKKGGPAIGAVVGTGGLGGGLYASSQPANYVVSSPVSNAMIADSSRVSKDQGFVGDEFVRASSFTAPRALTLDTKYQGVPVVAIWTGYAVLVVSKSGDKRRVVRGPGVVLLDYDESFEVMELSRGKPKTTDNLLRTVYLRTDNNQVTDIVQVETSDYVQFNLRLGYRVNFEGDSSKWWAVENYVKFLCDRMRSDLKGAIKKMPFTTFRPNATEILQGIVLGKDKGRVFTENNMRVTDVEVLAVDCLDQTIEGAFKQSALAVVRTNIELDQLKRGLEVTKEKQDVIKAEAEVRAETEVKKNELAIQVATSELNVLIAKLNNDLKSIEAKKDLSTSLEELKDYEFTQDLSRRKRAEDQILELKAKAQEMAIAAALADAENVAKRFVAASTGLDKLAEAVMSKNAAVEIAQALNIQRALGGDSFSDAASKVLGSIPALAPLLQRIVPNGNGQVMSPNGSSEKKSTLGA